MGHSVKTTVQNIKGVCGSEQNFTVPSADKSENK